MILLFHTFQAQAGNYEHPVTDCHFDGPQNDRVYWISTGLD